MKKSSHQLRKKSDDKLRIDFHEPNLMLHWITMKYAVSRHVRESAASPVIFEALRDAEHLHSNKAKYGTLCVEITSCRLKNHIALPN